MDQLKLEKWRAAFQQKMHELEIEYNTYLLPKKFEEVYELKVAQTWQDFYVWIDTDTVPLALQERITAALVETEPEDSV